MTVTVPGATGCSLSQGVFPSSLPSFKRKIWAPEGMLLMVQRTICASAGSVLERVGEPLFDSAHRMDQCGYLLMPSLCWKPPSVVRSCYLHLLARLRCYS